MGRPISDQHSPPPHAGAPPAPARARLRRLRPPSPVGSPLGVALAWGVHALTASGAVIAVVALHAIAAGDLAAASLWMLAALVIDAVDGSFARALDVQRAVPRIDGRRLDDIVDYLNYVIVPAFLLVEAGALAHPAWVAAPVLASAYGFSQRDAKTDDDFFLGFPSYWNVVAIYVWLLGVEPGVATTVVAALSVLVFVPFKYLYPSKMPVLWGTTAAAGALWLAALVAAIMAGDPELRVNLARVSLLFPAYYLLLSFLLGGWRGPAR